MAPRLFFPILARRGVFPGVQRYSRFSPKGEWNNRYRWIGVRGPVILRMASKWHLRAHPACGREKHYRGKLRSRSLAGRCPKKTFTRLGDGSYKGNYLWPMYGKTARSIIVAERIVETRKTSNTGARGD